MELQNKGVISKLETKINVKQKDVGVVHEEVLEN